MTEQQGPPEDYVRKTVIHRHLPEWYREYARPVRRALAEQRLKLTNFIEDAGIYRSVHAVKQRVKTESSVREAMLQGRREYLSDFKDLGGLRIVVHSQQDVRVIARFLTMQADRDDLMIVSDDEIRRENGYRARHMVVRVKGSYMRSAYAVDLEIQIRTLCQDVFNSLSRTYWYKRARVHPTPEDRDVLVGHLESAEAVVSKLREEADAAHAADPTDTLTPDSFMRIMTQSIGDPITIEEAVDQVLSLRDDRVQTNGDYIDFLAKHKAKVDELVELERPLGQDGHFESKGKSYLLYRYVARGEFDFMRKAIEGFVAAKGLGPTPSPEETPATA